MVIGTAAMYYVGALHVLNGTLTLGTLLVFSAYLLMLYQPIESLTYTAWAMEGATAGAKRCFEVLDRQDDVVDSPNAIAIESAKGAIGFNQVSFAYAADRPVLHDVDLAIEPNQMIAIVGGTGAGKSTLLSLVPRFYDPTFGFRDARRSRRARDQKEIVARADRHRPARHACFFPQPSAKTSPTGDRMRPKKKSSTPRNAPRRMNLSAKCRTVTRARSANAASN